MEDDAWWRERFARHLAMGAIGEEGQRALGRTTVTVVGAGALGSNAAELLVRMGFGHVKVIDGDVVELSNLHRNRMMTRSHVGMPKARVLAELLGATVDDASVEGLVDTVRPDSAHALLGGADVVLDALDNMESRYVVNDACVELGIPWVYGGVVATGGLVAPFPPDGPCLRCLFPHPPEPGSLPTPETHGVHPSAPAIVSSVQVAHATRFALGAMDRPRLLALDLWSDDWRVMDITRREDCPACGPSGWARGEM